MQKIRVVVFSKYQIVRSALRHLLATGHDIEIVAEVETQHQAEQAILRLRPDVVLVETVESSNPAIPKVAEKSDHKATIVVLTNQVNARVVRTMLSGGVTGLVLQQSSETELLLALRSAARGVKFLDPTLIDQIVLEGASYRQRAYDKHLLSKRELQVLKRLVQGYTSPEIARELHLSSKTVQTYRSRIYEKLEARSRAHLVRYAVDSGLISVNENLPE